MTIASVETALYRIKLPVPLSDSTHGIMTHFELVTVRLRDSDGVEGVGYTYTTGAGGIAAHALIDQGLRSVLMGADGDRIEDLWHKMWWRLHYGGRGGSVSLAVSACDIALYDLKSKRAGMPLWRFLGGYDPAVPCYAGGIDLEALAVVRVPDAAAAAGHDGDESFESTFHDDLRPSAAVRPSAEGLTPAPGRLPLLMQATVETIEDNRVKLTVTVPAAEFETAIDAAFRTIARDVRLPGFRPGKAPRRILEARIGAEAGRQQALQDAIPGYYADAVLANDVDVIAAPEINITAGEDDGDLEFEAVVEVRPVITLSGYEALRVTVPYAAVDDVAVDAQVNRVRDQHAEYVDHSRPLALDDYATLDITGTQDGEPVDGLSVTDFGYVVGSGVVVGELDDNLRGTKTGETIEFDAVLTERFGERAGETVHFSVTVGAAQEKVLPDLTDEWVDENTEWDDIATMRDEIRKRSDLMARVQAQMGLRDAVLATLANLVEVDAPESLVDQEVRTRVNDFGQRLAQQGVDFDQYFAITGMDPEEFLGQTREQATRAVLADLALRSVVVVASTATPLLCAAPTAMLFAVCVTTPQFLLLLVTFSTLTTMPEPAGMLATKALSSACVPRQPAQAARWASRRFCSSTGKGS